MMKLHFAIFSTMMCFAFTILLLCESCQDPFETFQQILTSRQQHGRLRPNETMKLSKERVFTKMECLDFCLRNPLCYSFQMKHKVSGGTKKYWICQTVIGQHSTPPRSTGFKRWIHFNVSSYELQEVSSLGQSVIFF